MDINLDETYKITNKNPVDKSADFETPQCMCLESLLEAAQLVQDILKDKL